MSAPYFRASRAERFIAVGRMVLASSSLFAVWIDPAEPANHQSLAYSLMAAYGLYSVLLAVNVWRVGQPGRRERIVTHVIDLLFFSLFPYFTKGLTSPTTIYFVFSMICATLRWRVQGVVWTAIAAIASHVTLAFVLGNVKLSADVETFGLVSRSVYLAVIGVLLGYLGAHEERTRLEIATLADWPAIDYPELEPALRGLLEHAAAVLVAPRVMLSWMEREEPWQYTADWHEGHLEWSRGAPPEDVDAGVHAAVAHCDFLRTGDPSSTVLLHTAIGFSRWVGQPFREPLASRIGAGPALGVKLRSRSLEGRLFVLGKNATADDLVLAGAVAALLAARLESLYLTRYLAEAAATEQRIRLARDLHDGVLQSLTGVALRLEDVRRLLAQRPEGTGEALATVEELQHLLLLEQRDLRFFIHELGPTRRTVTGGTVPLAAQLSELAHRLELEWDLQVELEVHGELDGVSGSLARDIYHIAREAMVNAARHGKATVVKSMVRATGGVVELSIADNGCGFPFEGRLTDAQLRSREIGPRTLRERVAALHGSLTLESAPSGARVEVNLPMEVPA
jgi:signal transduction histidine kinase